MTQKFPPINPKYPHILHGGDYNPGQWLDTSEIWDEDIHLMKLAHCNAMSGGVFSWVMYKPEEGVFNFKTEPQTVNLGEERFTSLLIGRILEGSVELPGYGIEVFEKEVAL